MVQDKQQQTIAVVGGGIAGISAAIELAKTGYFKVTLFEKNAELGGLSSSYEWEKISYDRFYHVILSADRHLLEFIQDINLESELYWRNIRSGFYGQGKLVSLSSILDFVRFPFLSFWQKIRMGLGIIYCVQIRNPSKLNKILAKEWLTRLFGVCAYENIWEPLLYSKLGNAKDIIAATIVWNTIRRLYGARSFFQKQEKMGHVRGSYHAILNGAGKRLSELQVRVRTNAVVLEVRPIAQSKKIAVTTSAATFSFDKVLFTIPCPEVFKLLNIGFEDSYWRQLKHVEYLGVVCVLLVLNRRLSPYYVINLLDKNLPFTGIIESTNVILPQETGGKYLVYLPKYLTNDDRLNYMADQQVIEIFIDKLRLIFPDLNNLHILHKNIFREKYVQPIQKIDALKSAISFRTTLPNVHLANSSMIGTSTLNNNAVIDIAKRATRAILEDSTKKRLTYSEVLFCRISKVGNFRALPNSFSG